MVELKVRIGTKGQVVIPKIFRENYKLYPKEEVIIKAENEGVVIKRQDIDVIAKFREIARKANLKKDDISIRKLRKIRDEQYEERARKAGIKI